MSASDQSKPTGNLQKIVIQPLKAALIQGLAQKLPVLIRVQAPDLDQKPSSARRPYHVGLVVDRSGSMSGRPLQEALRCAKYVVERLDPTDSAVLVVFDQEVKTLVGLTKVGDRAQFLQAIEQVRAGGTTNIHGGWLAGRQALGNPDGNGTDKNAEQAALSRVILLSDGNTNAGDITDTARIAALCAEAAEQGVSTSTYGLGRHFNEELMVEMGRRGGGNHYYGETAADLFEPFAEELDLISNLFAREVRLSLAAPKGVGIKLLNDYTLEQRDGFPIIRLPDITFGAESWAFVELDIPVDLATGDAIHLLQAAITARTPDGQPLAFADVDLGLRAVSAAAWDLLPSDSLVATRQAEVQAAEFLRLAREAADRDDWDLLQSMIVEARRRFAVNSWVIEVVGELGDLARRRDKVMFQKESLYSSYRFSSRLTPKDELILNQMDEGKVASYLRRKKSQGKAQFLKRDSENDS